MPNYDAVMFDWMLTLADYPPPREHLRRAHVEIGRPVGDDELDDILRRLDEAAGRPDVVAAAADEDRSKDHHRSATMLHLERAGIDTALAEGMYGLLGDPSFHPIYPDVASVLGSLSAEGVAVAVVSDIHVDLRDHARLAGIDGLVDHWILSFEHGVQKPDPAIFQLALDALGSDPATTLMVGDRPSHDGAATALGIDSMIIPVRQPRPGDRLGPVLDLVLGARR